MNSTSPLISCICITGDKPLELQRSLACFIKQDYPNTELVISYPEDDLLTINILNQVTQNFMIRIIRMERIREELTFTARNKAIEIANGKLICLWHDEHWFHTNRISDQYRVIKNGPFKSSIINRILLFDPKRQMTYQSKIKCWWETILCDKQVMLMACHTREQGTKPRHIIQFLFSQNVLYQISNSPHLYIYIFSRLSKNRITRTFRFADWEGLTEINHIIRDIIELDQYLLENK